MGGCGEGRCGAWLGGGVAGKRGGGGGGGRVGGRSGGTRWLWRVGGLGRDAAGFGGGDGGLGVDWYGGHGRRLIRICSWAGTVGKIERILAVFVCSCFHKARGVIRSRCTSSGMHETRKHATGAAPDHVLVMDEVSS